MVFYRNLVAAALDRAPDATMSAIRDEVVGFQMPGQGMPNFLRNSATIAKAGIYDLRLHHDDVIAPVLRFWKIFTRDDFGPEGEQAREELATFMTALDEQATRFVEQARPRSASALPRRRPEGLRARARRLRRRLRSQMQRPTMIAPAMMTRNSVPCPL